MAQVKSPYFTTAIIISLVTAGSAQLDITPSTCVNPAQFTACYQQAQSASLNCYAEAGNDEDRRAVCACDLDLAEIYCAVESCWNVVYGCEYQSLAFAWDAYCAQTIGDIPFFPAPDNAPGGCSCNLGRILGNFTAVKNHYTPCVSGGGNVLACGCCLAGGEITSIYSLCPQDTLAAIGLSGIETTLASAYSNPALCKPYFSQYDCVRDLGFPAIGAYSYMTALPVSTGTLTPSPTAAAATTPPLRGSTIAVSAGGVQTILTLLSAAGATGAGSASSASASTPLAGSPSQSAVGSTTAASGGTTSRGTRCARGGYGAIGLVGLVLVCFMVFWI